jgi:DNA-binding Xre family transcriptional regulator
MTDTRTALKNGLNLDRAETSKPVAETSKKEGVDSSSNIGESEDSQAGIDAIVEKTQSHLDDISAKKKPEPKKRRGRPTTSHRITKIHLILEKRGLTRKDLFNLIAKKYPDEPISPDAVSRIVSGKRKYYSTPTLFRICGALGVTPNQVLEYEDEIV